MKVVINKCFGGFGLSDQAIETLADLKGIRLYKAASKRSIFASHYYTDPELEDYYSPDYPRYDEDLVKVVETLGEAANSSFSDLVVVEIPDGVNYYVDEYDGMETIRETHRSWG